MCLVGANISNLVASLRPFSLPSQTLSSWEEMKRNSGHVQRPSPLCLRIGQGFSRCLCMTHQLSDRYWILFCIPLHFHGIWCLSSYSTFSALSRHRGRAHSLRGDDSLRMVEL